MQQLTNALPFALQKFMFAHYPGAEKAALKAIKHFKGNSISEEEKAALLKDILHCRRNYLSSSEEYFIYDLKNWPEEERKQFISSNERIYLAYKFNPRKVRKLFKDKYKTYEKFKPYYKRDAINITPGNDNNLKAFTDFVENHPKIIIKPVDGACGFGIKVVESKDIKDCNKYLSELLIKTPSGCIVEEFVVQAKEFAEFHPSSLNTIRIATVRLDDRVEIVGSFFRFGQNNAVIDNAAQGGIFATVDIEKGIIRNSSDKNLKVYDVHPHSGKQIIGYKIPHWDEAVAFVKELATVVPECRYVGWDVALTDEGWVLIEGNHRGEFIWQIADRKGFRDEIYALLNEVKHK